MAGRRARRGGVHELRIALYLTQELLLLLEQAGFQDVTMRAGYEDREPTAEDEFVVFLARKAS